MAYFESNVNGGMQEGMGGSDEASIWDSFFDDGISEPNEPDGGDAGGEPGDDGTGAVQEGGGQPATSKASVSEATATSKAAAGQQGGQNALPDVDAVVQQRVDAAIARQFGGMINPYTGRPITTEAELSAYHQAFAAEEQERRLRESGIDRNVLDAAISGHPVVQQANAMMQEQQQRQANDFMAQEFAALLQEFPDCGLKDARELMNTPEGMETLHLWQSSPISLKTAYAATHLKEIRAKQSKAVRQGVLNEVNGKAHLTQTNTGGKGGEEMPADVDEAYQIYFPELNAAGRYDLWKRTNG